MGARMVAFLESHSGLDCLDCLAEKGNPKVSGISWKPQLMSHRVATGACMSISPQAHAFQSECVRRPFLLAVGVADSSARLTLASQAALAALIRGT